VPEELSPELLASAESGDAEAQNAVGRYYAQHGSGADGAELAQTWFQRAADRGLPAARHNLGVLALREGRDDLARSCFIAAANEGWPPSIFSLGAILEKVGDAEGAAKLYAKAARQGYADAQDALAGLIFAVETTEAYEISRGWSELASAQGNANADARLAIIYHEGLGVERDPQRAATYFLRAARAGHAQAQLMIGVAYDMGAGVEVNRLESAFWLTLSSLQNETAKHYLATRVAPTLSQDERIALMDRLQKVIGT
jgi:TPR repeat protein